MIKIIVVCLAKCSIRGFYINIGSLKQSRSFTININIKIDFTYQKSCFVITFCGVVSKSGCIQSTILTSIDERSRATLHYKTKDTLPSNLTVLNSLWSSRGKADRIQWLLVLAILDGLVITITFCFWERITLATWEQSNTSKYLVLLGLAKLTFIDLEYGPKNYDKDDDVTRRQTRFRVSVPKVIA